MYLLTTMYTAVLKQSSILPQDVMSPDSLKMWKAPSEEILDEIEQSLKQNGYIK